MISSDDEIIAGELLLLRRMRSSNPHPAVQEPYRPNRKTAAATHTMAPRVARLTMASTTTRVAHPYGDYYRSDHGW
jgi:hypothetical protein